MDDCPRLLDIHRASHWEPLPLQQRLRRYSNSCLKRGPTPGVLYIPRVLNKPATIWNRDRDAARIGCDLIIALMHPAFLPSLWRSLVPHYGTATRLSNDTVRSS